MAVKMVVYMCVECCTVELIFATLCVIHYAFLSLVHVFGTTLLPHHLRLHLSND